MAIMLAQFPRIIGAAIMRGGTNLRICNFTNFVETNFADAINITLNVHDYTTKNLRAKFEVGGRS